MTRSRRVSAARPRTLPCSSPCPCHAHLPVIVQCACQTEGVGREQHSEERRRWREQDRVIWIRLDDCRHILGRLAQAAQVERQVVTSDSFRMGAAKDAMARAFVALLRTGQVDEKRLMGTMAVWEVFERRLGVLDCTYGLKEVWRGLARSAVAMEQGIVEDTKGWPHWMVPVEEEHGLSQDEQVCEIWFASVGDEVYLHANAAFERMFMTALDIRSRFSSLRLMSFYVWMAIVSVTDLTSFYEALVEGLLAREATESYVVVKCETKSGERRMFLVGISSHFGRTPDGGVPTRGYCVRLCPIGHSAVLSSPLLAWPEEEARAEAMHVA